MDKLKRFLATPDHSLFTNVALLLLRLAVGIAFVMHGWGKIQAPFSWMGPEAPVPGVFQLLAAVAEFGGGLALIAGFLVPVASLGLVITMAVATAFLTFGLHAPYVIMTKEMGPSSELAVTYLCISLLLIDIGPGAFSLDRQIFGVRRRE